MSEVFSKNLRDLCANYESIAQVCRAIGINRQQFNRYLSGRGMPSAHNLRRIAKFFGVVESELLSAQADAAFSGTRRRNGWAETPARQIAEIFADQARHMSRYLGFYHGHFMTPTWDDHIMRTLIWLREENGYVVTKTFERAFSEDQSIIQKTRYSGLAAYRGNRIYVIERAYSDDGFVSESVLFPAHRQKVVFLQGLTMGVATRPRLGPYSSPTIWKRIPGATSIRQAAEATGVFPKDSLKIDPAARKHLQDHKPDVAPMT